MNSLSHAIKNYSPQRTICRSSYLLCTHHRCINCKTINFITTIINIYSKGIQLHRIHQCTTYTMQVFAGTVYATAILSICHTYALCQKRLVFETEVSLNVSCGLLSIFSQEPNPKV